MSTSKSLDLLRSSLRRTSKIKLTEIVFWAVAFATPFIFPSHNMMISEIAITALFALSLDLVLGYTGIVSLGHAAFFGFGVYSAALFAKFFIADPFQNGIHSSHMIVFPTSHHAGRSISFAHSEHRVNFSGSLVGDASNSWN